MRRTEVQIRYAVEKFDVTGLGEVVVLAGPNGVARPDCSLT